MESSDDNLIEIIDFYEEFHDSEISKLTERELTTFYEIGDDEPDTFLAALNETNESEYVCPMCKLVFVGKKAIKDHVKRYFKYICKVCHKRYFREKYLQRHLTNAHLPSKNLGCPFPDCDKKFKAVYNLKQHLLLHGDERKYVCDYAGCGKSFKQKPGLQQHIRFMHKCNETFCRRCRKRVINLATHQLTCPRALKRQSDNKDTSKNVIIVPCYDESNSTSSFASSEPESEARPEINVEHEISAIWKFDESD